MENSILKCGIVILNYNDYATTEALLARIKDSSEIDHIVVVDNDSPNDSYERLKKYESSRVSVIQSGRNGGYSFGNNVGTRYLIDNFKPDIIGIANPDTEFDGAFVAKMKQIFEDYPDYSMLTGLMSNHQRGNLGVCFWDDESTPGAFIFSLCHELFVRPFVNLSKALFRRNVMRPERNYARLQEIIHSPCEVSRVWGVGGSLFFIRREDFEAAGLFDENVFLYYEEHILAYKLNRRLWKKAGVVNSIEYVHDHKAPKDDSRLARLNRGINSLKIRDASSLYYFNNYVTDSRFLQGLYAFLLKLRWLKTYTAYYFKRLIYRI